MEVRLNARDVPGLRIGQDDALNTPQTGRSGRREFFGVPLTFSPMPSNLWLLVPLITPTGEDRTMNHRVIAASTLTAAVGLALAMQAPGVRAQGMANPPQIVKDNMARMQKDKLQKCYGINAVAKNDCAEGQHSCAGQATQARDAKSFVLLPAGDCAKIQGGKLTAS
jgi:uncharacterized membrane protein